jgi:5'-methylthioadenosine phosphorylase
MKHLGVTDLLSVSAVGGLRADLPPGTFVIVDQFIDRTIARAKSFFGQASWHMCRWPIPCARGWATTCSARWLRCSVPHVRGGTYLAMEGPQFSTLAESRLYRSWNCDVIGMTNMPEAKLAREAELCYASVAMVTDFDCWHPDHEAVTVEAVVSVLSSNAEKARSLVLGAAQALGADEHGAQCGCRQALQYALITSPQARDPDVVQRLKFIASRVL